MITAASFFTGIGGLDLAAIAAGFRVTHMSEIDDYARAVLRTRFPDTTLLGDIRHVHANDIGSPDVIFGGFPCQDISASGKGLGLAGKRSGLYFHLERLISDVRPRGLILENVAVISVRGGTRIVAGLAALGYDTTWITVPASRFGSPQNRARWFLLGYSGSERLHAAASSRALSRDTDGSGEIRQSHQRVGVSNAPESTRPTRRTAVGLRRQSRMDAQSRMGRDAHGVPAGLDISQHKFTAGSWTVAPPDEPSRLASPEPQAAHRLTALGNAVVPQQAYPIFVTLHKILNEED